MPSLLADEQDQWEKTRQKVRLGDVCSKIGSGATPSGGKDVYLEEGTYTLIRSQNVYNQGFHHEGLVFLSEHHAKELQNVEVFEEDVLLNITGDSVARVCQVAPEVLPARVNQHVAIIRPDSGNLDPGYLRYYLVSPEMQDLLLSWAASGGTRNALTKGMIESLEILVPPLADQQAIAHVLGTLDDKIELNRRMNQTLEEMARAIFQDWFVDFGPIRAKMEEQEPYLPPELWNLFPDNLVDSEIGEIPHTWELKSINKVLTAKNIRVGETKLPEYSCTNTGLYPRSKYFNKQLSKANSKNKVVHHGDMVFGLSRQILNFGLMKDTIGCVSPAYRVYTIDDNIIDPDLAERMIRTHTEYYYGAIAGSSREGQSISPDALSLLNILCPPVTLQETFYAEIEPIAQRRKILEDEAEGLITQRDALLPKLLSGNLEFSYF